MSKKLKISEEELIKLIEQAVEERMPFDGQGIPGIVPMDMDMGGEDIDIEDEEDQEELEQILTPEEIAGLMEEQIVQLQDRAQYTEELLADVLEFTETLMSDLTMNPDLQLSKSKQKLRALETRAGREIFWLKSRRL